MPEPPPARIYLDNAATSFPKPEEVYRAVDDYQRRLGTAVGRGAYREASELQGIVQRARVLAAELVHAEGAERVVFTLNGTDSLNLALHGTLRAGDHVITSLLEHNSVLRPLRDLQDRLGVAVDYVAPDAEGRINPDEFRRLLRTETRLIALTHASNVTGAVQPVEEVGRIAREAGVLFLVDAAQTAGHWPIDVRAMQIDLLACAGHKGLLGPLGTGLLYVRPGVEKELRSIRQGGTGTQSETDRQPDELPEKYESGNHNAPGICGLGAGLEWIKGRGTEDRGPPNRRSPLPDPRPPTPDPRGEAGDWTTLESICAHEAALTGRLLEGLGAVPGVRVYGPAGTAARVGVVSLTLDRVEPQVLATLLDENFGIQARAGLHCAPGAHRCLGTLETGGTLRLSVGPFNTPDDIEATLVALHQIALAAW